MRFTLYYSLRLQTLLVLKETHMKCFEAVSPFTMCGYLSDVGLVNVPVTTPRDVVHTSICTSDLTLFMFLVVL